MKPNEYSELLNWHDEQIGMYSLGILNGPVYVLKKTSPTTHQFLVSPAWQKGSIQVNGQIYHELLLLYDMNSDVVVMKHPDPGYIHGVELRNIDRFTLHGHSFVWLENISFSHGFYDELFRGSILGLYVKRIKKERASDAGIAEYRERDFYYFQYHNDLVPFRNIKSIYEVMPEKKERIKKLKKQSGLRPSVKRESDLIDFMTLLEKNIVE